MTTSKTAHIEVPSSQQEAYAELIEKIKNRQKGRLMPLFIRDLWIEALLSGRYTQAKGYMLTSLSKGEETTPGNCCLGVLGMAVGLTPEDDTVLPSGGTRLVYEGKAASTYSFLEDDFADMLGLNFETQRTLATANDNWKLPFPIIAKAIEEAL